MTMDYGTVWHGRADWCPRMALWQHASGVPKGANHDFPPVIPPLPMLHCLSTALRLPFPVARRSVRSHKSRHRKYVPFCHIDQLEYNHSPTCNRRDSTSIHILDDYSLLIIFYLCRPVLLDEDENDELLLIQGGAWDRERWWYKLAHVCRRWRQLIFGSSSYLGLRLLCTHGTPVAEMLAHSPPFPLVIDYLNGERKITPDDKEGILLALRHCDRVLRIRLRMPVANLKNLIVAMDREFPILEFLYIGSPNKHKTTLILPKTLEAPHLLHIGLENFAFSIQSSLLLAAVGLKTLSLHNILPSAYFSPAGLLQRLSLMPQLETLEISFHSPIASRYVEQLPYPPMMTHVILPNLRRFAFQGVSAYLEALLPGVAMPLLETLQIVFFNQLSFNLPHLVQLLGRTENLRSKSAKLWFQRDAVIVATFPHEGSERYNFCIQVICSHFDWQVAISAQIVNMLRPVFVAVEHLTLDYHEHHSSLDWHSEADRTQWHGLLKSFSNVKTLLVGDSLIGGLSRSLRLNYGERPLELLPTLKELVCYSKGNPAYTFLPFINERKAAGVSVSLTVVPLSS